MTPASKIVGKVSITANGIWDKTKDYEELCLVYDEVTSKSYISKQIVPAGTLITNNKYWQPVNATGYKDNNIVIISDVSSTGQLLRYTLTSAISTINTVDRRAGMILGFYGNKNDGTNNGTWYLYQFNSDDVTKFNDVSYWKTIYSNVNKFKGYFETEIELKKNVTVPEEGDFAFVGKDFSESIVYVCLEDKVWLKTTAFVLNFANKFEAIYSRDIKELKIVENDETYSDRANKDAKGNVIDETYVSKSVLANATRNAVYKALLEAELPEDSINWNNLSDSLKELIIKRTAVNGEPFIVDGEDIIKRCGVLKLADKKYNIEKFTGLGRVYLRKNMTDGVNYLEQHMFTKANTIYIIQYDYCLDGNTITIPENCILFFVGGSFNKGSIILNDTLVCGAFSSLKEVIKTKYIGGKFRKGQTDFENAPMWWNGVQWLTYSGNETVVPVNYLTFDDVKDFVDNHTKELKDWFETSIASYYTKKEVDNLLTSVYTTLRNYYTKDEVNNKFDEVNENLEYIKDILGGNNLYQVKGQLEDLGEHYKNLYNICKFIKDFMTSKDELDNTINSWKELDSFLNQITDTDSLTTLLEDLYNKLNNKIDTNIIYLRNA